MLLLRLQAPETALEELEGAYSLEEEQGLDLMCRSYSFAPEVLAGYPFAVLWCPCDTARALVWVPLLRLPALAVSHALVQAQGHRDHHFHSHLRPLTANL